MRFLLWISIALIILTGCATVTLKSEGVDHKRIFGIDCSGAAVPIQVCYDKATKLCPKGYVKLSDEAPYMRGVNPEITEIAMSVPGVRKGITIKCE